MAILILLLISLTIIKLLLNWQFNYAHERTHARIYENNNIKYKMKVTPFDSWCEGETETKETIRDHNMTEIIGYHSKVIYDLVYYLITVIILIKVL